MRNGSGGTVLRQIDSVFRNGSFSDATDRRLLERFVVDGDQGALEALIARHESLVLGVCRRILRNRHDVEDAFQATLLVLVRQARTLRVGGSLGPWLYGVAYRVAVRARANASRRERLDRSRLLAAREQLDADVALDRSELQPILHEELNRLPERLRAPIVLCYLEGLTHESAARQLQWPVGTVRSRLARGRELLRSRLTRRGTACSPALLISALCADPMSAEFSSGFIRSSVRAATHVWAGTMTAEAVSAEVVALMEGVVMSMLTTRMKSLVGVLLACGAIGLGAVVYAYQAPPRATTVGVAQPVTANGEWGATDSTTFFKTYYVGDMIMAKPPTPEQLQPRATRDPARHIDTDALEAQAPRVDMGPLIDLVISTTAPKQVASKSAPKRWKVRDDSRNGSDQGRLTEENVLGTITPFYLSMSLIVRTDAETHDRIADLFRGIRRLQEHVDARRAGAKTAPDFLEPAQPTAGAPTVIVEGGMDAAPFPQRESGAEPRSDQTPSARRTSPAGVDEVQRLRKLLQEVNDKIEHLIRERDNAKSARPHQSSVR